MTARRANAHAGANPRANPALSPCRSNSGIGIRRIDAPFPTSLPVGFRGYYSFLCLSIRVAAVRRHVRSAARVSRFGGGTVRVEAPLPRQPWKMRRVSSENPVRNCPQSSSSQIRSVGGLRVSPSRASSDQSCCGEAATTKFFREHELCQRAALGDSSLCSSPERRGRDGRVPSSRRYGESRVRRTIEIS
jgi:hypothetical protein